MKIPAFLLYNYICENILANLEIIWYNNKNIDFARLYFLNLRFEKYVILYESKTELCFSFHCLWFEKYVILYESKTILEQCSFNIWFEKYVILYESKTCGGIFPKST